MPASGSIPAARFLLSLLVSGTLALAALTAPAEAAGPESFGIAAGGNLQNEGDALMGRDLDVMRSAGARWVRIDINWAQIQAAGPNSFYWDDIDRLVRGATARGLKVLGLIVYTPEWARPAGAEASFGPDPNAYARFAAKAVEHYSALGVQHYEIWNEPNIRGFWAPRPDAADYTRMLKAAYSSIKAVNPNATVITAGTSPAASDGTDIAPVDFLRGIYRHGGGDSFDAVGHHPYGWPALPGETQDWNAWHQMYGTSPSLRSTMIANGDGAKKIWATEFGAPTGGPDGSHISERTQAEIIERGMRLWKTYDWAGGLFSYQHRDLGTNDSTRENHFGLVRNDFSPKPAFAAYREAAAPPAGDPPPPSNPTPPQSPSPQPPSPQPDPTRMKVKGKGDGGGKVKGKVLAKRSASSYSGYSRRPLEGRVQLGLYVKSDRGWHRTGHRHRTALKRNGKFKVKLRAMRRHLRPGVYRVRAVYLGSRTLRPTSSRTPRFRLG